MLAGTAAQTPQSFDDVCKRNIEKHIEYAEAYNAVMRLREDLSRAEMRLNNADGDRHNTLDAVSGFYAKGPACYGVESASVTNYKR